MDLAQSSRTLTAGHRRPLPNVNGVTHRTGSVILSFSLERWPTNTVFCHSFFQSRNVAVHLCLILRYALKNIENRTYVRLDAKCRETMRIACGNIAVQEKRDEVYAVIPL